MISMSGQTESSLAAARIRVIEIESAVVHVAQSLRRLRFPGHNLSNPSIVIYGMPPRRCSFSHRCIQGCESLKSTLNRQVSACDHYTAARRFHRCQQHFRQVVEASPGFYFQYHLCSPIRSSILMSFSHPCEEFGNRSRHFKNDSSNHRWTRMNTD